MVLQVNFFSIFDETDTYVGKHVVFGRVLRGYQEVVQKIAEVSVDAKDRPIVPVTIANCGELVMRSQTKGDPVESEGANCRTITKFN
jgi:peptidyl-prolyl isomerase G (cyclophilin G)